MPFRTIEDSDVRSIWKCEESECDSEEKEVVLDPTYYQDNGTPTCECGEDMIYSHTEVRGKK